MAPHPFRLPSLALVALSICLSIAVIGCAGRTLNFYNSQHQTNIWLLPIWPNHFDTRELQSLIATSVAILVLNTILVSVLFISALPTNLIVLTSTLLSTICALISLIIPSLLNNHAPRRDTLQTWTCRWSHTDINQEQGPPSQFGSICRETRFATYTQIPIFLIQLCLLAMAISTTFSNKRSDASRRLDSDAEKGHQEHELGQVRNASFDTKSEGSPRSVQREEEAARNGGAKAVGFA